MPPEHDRTPPSREAHVPDDKELTALERLASDAQASFFDATIALDNYLAGHPDPDDERNPQQIRAELAATKEAARAALHDANRNWIAVRDRRDHLRKTRRDLKRERTELAERNRELEQQLEAAKTRERQQRTALIAVLATLSAGLTFVIWRTWISDVDTQAMQRPEAPDYWGGTSLFFAIAAIAVVIASRARRDWIIYPAALLVPTVAAACAYGIKDERSWQKQAKQVFATYTHRFPKGQLHDVGFRDQYEDQLTVCAPDGGKPFETTPMFCLMMDMRLPRGRQVIGGYRYPRDSAARTDCFGDAVGCIDDST
jgi:hypothetical protein